MKRMVRFRSLYLRAIVIALAAGCLAVQANTFDPHPHMTLEKPHRFQPTPGVCYHSVPNFKTGQSDLLPNPCPSGDPGAQTGEQPTN